MGAAWRRGDGTRVRARVTENACVHTGACGSSHGAPVRLYVQQKDAQLACDPFNHDLCPVPYASVYVRAWYFAITVVRTKG